MNGEIRNKLKVLLSQPNRDELLDDPRRLSELVRERLGADNRREAGFLILVLREDVPKRLLAMSTSSLSDTMLDNYAKKLSEDIGLKPEIARDAVATWAEGLGLKIGSAAQPGGSPQTPFEVQRAQERERLRNEQAGKPVPAAGQPWQSPPQPQQPQPQQPPAQPVGGQPTGAAVRPLYAQAFRLLRTQKPQPQIIAELQKTGLHSATAADIVAKVGTATTIMRDAYRKAGLKAAGIGAAWCIGGILVTAITYSMVATSGGTYFVAWGAVIFGFIQAIRGLFVAMRQPSEDEIMRLVGLG